MFRTSEKTANLVAESQISNLRGVLRIDFTSREIPRPDDDAFHPELAQSAIGERFLRILGTVARDHAFDHPKDDRVLILVNRQKLEPKVQNLIIRQFGLLEEQLSTKTALSALAEDFADWIDKNPYECEEHEIEVDGKGQVYVRHPNIAPLSDW